MTHDSPRSAPPDALLTAPANINPHEFDAHSTRALEAAGVGTWLWDASTNLMYWDEVTHALFGVKPGNVAVRCTEMEELIHPDDRERVRAETAHCAEKGADFRSDYRVVWPSDGSTHVLRARGKFYRDPETGAARMSGACWDISDQRATEEALAQERFFLRTLMEKLPDKIYFKDAHSRFLGVSDANLPWFGAKSPIEVIGKSDFDFFSEEHARQAFEDEQRIIRTGEPLLDFVEKETWHDGRETWVSTTKVPLRDARGKIIGTFGLSRDITDRRRAEEQLARYAEELRRRNAELEEDLEMARELQNALMPRQYPCFSPDAAMPGGALRFSHFFNPSTAVSGDFFDILKLSDTTAGIFICDVMGHGVRAALVAAIVRALVGELSASVSAPGAFLNQLNRKLSGILRQSDIPMFASASYVVADIAGGELLYANAGHPNPLCIRGGDDGRPGKALPLLPGKRGPVLGMFDTAQYGTSRAQLSARDKVLLFTDGLFEVEGAGGELYNERSLIHAVSRRADLAASDICREVLSEIQQFSANKQFSDDVCLVGVEVERLAS